jgi:hypothetical protein
MEVTAPGGKPVWIPLNFFTKKDRQLVLSEVRKVLKAGREA